MAAEPPGEREALIASALGREWYHTIEIAPGVRTPGLVDLRSVAPRVLPDDLSGVRALDVGTFDGFWAFELERRRAAEVVAAGDVRPAGRRVPRAPPRRALRAGARAAGIAGAPGGELDL